MNFYENKQEPEKAVLIAVDTGEYDCETSLDELEELAKTAGAEVVGRLWQKRDKPDNALFLGSGRLEELAEFCEGNEIDLVIADSELSPGDAPSFADVWADTEYRPRNDADACARYGAGRCDCSV